MGSLIKANPIPWAKEENMKLEFWKDGQSVKVDSIDSRAEIGQVVILDHVNFGGNPNSTKHPLAKYPQPCAFTIVDKEKDADGYGCFVVLDDKGNRIALSWTDASYLYEANEWLAWNRAHAREKLSRKERRIELLEGHLDLLKSIMAQQGVRIVSEEVAKQLGIDQP
jgi:hypothetical protein